MNLSTATVPELKAAAKAAGIKGYSTMKKADLLAALTPVETAKPESFVQGIVTAIRNAREERSNKGRKASRNSVKTPKQTLYKKVEGYRNQRNGGKITPKQARRYVKAAAQGAPAGA